MLFGWNAREYIFPLAIIIVGLNVGFYWIQSDIFRPRLSAEQIESERNERSTPRSFVLPATPAVAYEQEMRARKSAAIAKSEKQLARCTGRLIDLGYDVGDEAVMFNAKLVEAIFEFQESKGLRATGKLDRATIARLSCNEQ